MPDERYILTLRPEGDGPPAPVRLRRCLKAMLRQYGLRCIAVSQTNPEPGGDAAKDKQ